jgi:flagellar biosynthetic protein FliR
MILLNQDLVMKELVAFMLLAVRIGALFAAAPILSATAVSLPIRIALTMALTIALASTLKVPDVDLLSPIGALTLAREALLGLSIGLVFQLAFAAINVAGEQMAGAMGLGFAAMVDPQTGAQSPVISQFLSIMMTMIFLVTEGHHILLRLLATSYDVLPIGTDFNGDMFLGIVKAGTLIFSAALLIAAPVVFLIFLTNIIVGFMTRVAPQMNIFSIGFTITIFMGFAVLLVSLPTIGNGMSGLLQAVAGIVRDLILGKGAPA